MRAIRCGVVALGLLAFGGCGGGTSDHEAAGRVVTRYLGLVRDVPYDSDRACALLAPAAQREVAGLIAQIVPSARTRAKYLGAVHGATPCAKALSSLVLFGSLDYAERGVTDAPPEAPVRVQSISSTAAGVTVQLADSSVRVPLVKRNGHWLIARVSPRR